MQGIKLKLKLKNSPTEEQLMDLQYNLMHRFDPSAFKMVADGGNKVPIVEIVESRPGETWVEIMVRGDYYYYAHEFGFGLKITAILLYLTRTYSTPEAEVWYRPEIDRDSTDEGFKFDEKKALNLLYHFVDHGRLPFLRALTCFQNRDGVEKPFMPTLWGAHDEGL